MPFFEPLFRDRRDAGRQLAAALAAYRQDRPVVLALPRGGVPVGFEVAKALTAPLDVLLVRKIGAPGHEELALGAIVDGQDPQLVLNEDVVRGVAPRPGYIEAEKARQLAEIERRRQNYLGDRPPLSVDVVSEFLLPVLKQDRACALERYRALLLEFPDDGVAHRMVKRLAAP